MVFTGRPSADKSSIIRRVVGLKVATGKHLGTARWISKYPLSAKTGEWLGALKNAIHERLVAKGYGTHFKIH